MPVPIENYDLFIGKKYMERQERKSMSHIVDKWWDDSHIIYKDDLPSNVTILEESDDTKEKGLIFYVNKDNIITKYKRC